VSNHFLSERKECTDALLIQCGALTAVGEKNQFSSLVLQCIRSSSLGVFCHQSFLATHVLQPNICILLDVGTRPEPKSLYHLWKAFDLNSNVGGACGEIATFKGKTWRSLLNPLGESVSLA